jgi:hypothetical protein
MQILTPNDRAKAKSLIDLCKERSILTLNPPKASDELTSRMHCAIRCIAKQVKWAGEYRSEETWKLIFVAAAYGQEILPSPNGSGFVVVQKQTRGMSGSQKHDLTEYVYEFGAQRGVEFDD